MKITNTLNQAGQGYIELTFAVGEYSEEYTRHGLIKYLVESKLSKELWSDLRTGVGERTILIKSSRESTMFLLKHQELIEKISIVSTLGDLYRLQKKLDIA